ncbi:MAG TPA: hypothetical protein VND21_00970, partial [Planctomycetota bacterium]|nr:hypothetical protein [Planctomycetota bacterium]
MHHATTYALGLATGAVVAAIALHATRGGPGGEPVDGAAEGSPPVAATGGARLTGRPPGVATAPGGEGHAERFETWYEEATARLPDPRRARSILWLGLVRAYAAAGRHTDLRRACDRALDAGVPPAELLETLRTAGSSPSLEGLMTRHPEATWDLRSRLVASDPRDPAPVLEALGALRERLRAQGEGQPAPAEPPGLPGLAA